MKKREKLFPDLANSDAEKEWVGMPEFVQEEEKEYQKIIVRFNSKKDVKKFAKLINQKITSQTKGLWYPKIIIKKYMNKRWIDKK